MKGLVLVGLLFVMALPSLADSGLPNVSDARDLEMFLTGARAGLIQVRETADPMSPLLYEIQVVYIPQLAGPTNPAIYRSGPVLFIAVWSPEMADGFGFFRFDEDQVFMGSAPGFTSSYRTVAGTFTTVEGTSSDAVLILVDEETGDVGVVLPHQTIQVGLDALDVVPTGAPFSFVDVDTVAGPVPFGLNLWNLVAAQSEDATMVVALLGSTTERGDPGLPLQFAASQLDLLSVLEAATPWVFSTPYGEDAIRAALDVPIAQGVAAEGIGGWTSKPGNYVRIEVVYPVNTTGTEPFAASGPAVSNGVLSVQGTTTELYTGGSDVYNVVHWPCGSNVQPEHTFDVDKRFSCTGGTFDVTLHVELNTQTHYTSATWEIIAGTGTCANLSLVSGTGFLTGTPACAAMSGSLGCDFWSGITDVYEGHIYLSN